VLQAWLQRPDQPTEVAVCSFELSIDISQ
jgi:hypothetical protein